MSSSLKKPSGFFHRFDQNVPTICLSHSLTVLSKYTQQFAQNLFNHIPIGFFESLWSNWTKLRVSFESFQMNLPDMFWANCWIYFERTLNGWLRHMVGTFWSNLWNKPLGFFKKNPHVLWQVLLKLTHNLPTDPVKIKVVSIENFPTMDPLCWVWVNCLKTLNKLSMYPTGKTLSVPSDSGQLTGWGLVTTSQRTRTLWNTCRALEQRSHGAWWHSS